MVSGRGSERRTQRRIACRLDVRLTRQSRLQTYFTKNLSGGGLFLEVGERIPEGERIQLDLTLPGDERPLSLLAEVVHQHTYKELDEEMNEVEKIGLGLRFVNLSGAQQARLERYLEAEAAG